ncbi:hypothetical protein H3V53_36550 [Paraburkholderia bengalensis]|uniref:Uncharacterized protein n=1 Tax=Paraburkholderia bengalensis TaxID=2747562 RepID=A0ABU8J3M9_9BURK
MPENIANDLSTFGGVTASDYANILAADPFASVGDDTGERPLPPARYVYTGISLPYQEAPAEAPSSGTEYDVSDENLDKSQHAEESSTSFKVEAGAGSEKIGSSVKAIGQWTWTNKWSWETSKDYKATAKVKFGPPSSGYSGTTLFDVYEDMLFHTFMFRRATPAIAAQGLLTDQSGHPLPNEKIRFIIGMQTLTTYTNSRGEYKIPLRIQHQGVVTAKIIARGREKKMRVPISLHQPAVLDLRM